MLVCTRNTCASEAELPWTLLHYRVKGWGNKTEIHFSLYHFCSTLPNIFWAMWYCCMSGIHHHLLPSHFLPEWTVNTHTHSKYMYLFLTMTLRLSAEPGPVVQASSFRWTLQHVAGFAAEANNTAYCKLFSQTDTMHRNTWISTEPGRIT